MEALHFWALGGVDPGASKLLHVQFLLLGVAFVGAAVSLMARLGLSSTVAWQAAALAATNPIFGSQLLTALADAPLAIFVTVGALALLPNDEGRSFPGLAALMLSAGAATKNEGAVYVLALIVACISVGRGRKRFRTAALIGVVSLAVILPWRILVAIHGIHSRDFRLSHAFDIAYLVGHADRLASAAWGLTTAFRWLPLLLLFFVAVVWAIRARALPVAKFVLIATSIPLAFFAAVYWTADRDLDWLISSSAFRVVLPIATLMAVTIPTLLARGGPPDLLSPRPSSSEAVS
jgi:uncharacterized membrane protein